MMHQMFSIGERSGLLASIQESNELHLLSLLQLSSFFVYFYFLKYLLKSVILHLFKYILFEVLYYILKHIHY